MSKRYNPLALAKQKQEWDIRSKYVRKKLIDLDMSQRELARRIPMSYSYLNKILCGYKSGETYWEKIMEVIEKK